MSNWTRAHDAWIARECEEWQQIVSGPQRGFWRRPDGVHEVDEPSYLTDPAAAIRAGEAWQSKKPQRRTIQVRWRDEMKIVELLDYSDIMDKKITHASGVTLSAALAQALCRATGGPE